ncbi:MAG: chain-length determining protein [Deltaproteobacteria bacterium RIFCSPLOWO2_02_FULL_53_8]|nr:MAG: chain-length determining protein [Deltaproteobacteria bacterium RIFCSPLOWO2_02_FULL_53_8]
MIESIKKLPATDRAQRLFETLQGALAPAMLRRRTFLIAALAIILASVYWGIIASDRYVSEAQVVIERTDMTASLGMDLGAFMAGSVGGNRADQLLLRTHLLSVDMLNKLDAKLNLRAHYSDTSRDILSRMWRKEIEQEWFHKHYQARTQVELDDYAGVLVIKAQGYEPKMAHDIAATLVDEGERYMNELGHRRAQEQVIFLEKQVAEMSQKALQTRQELLVFQNQKGMLSPQSLAETLLTTVNRLEAQLTDLKARRSSLLGYLSPSAPGVVELDMQIQGIEKQLLQEQSRLTSPKGQTLNRTVEEYQRLEMTAKFAEDVYKTALVALEKGRIEALRTLKKVSVLQSPTLPQYPLEPRRLYNITVFIIMALILAGIVHLLAAIIRDHRD